MSDLHVSKPTAAVSEESFMADRLRFWSGVTGLTVKTTVALIYFCAWLWWCSATSFGFLHMLALPLVVTLIFLFL